MKRGAFVIVLRYQIDLGWPSRSDGSIREAIDRTASRRKRSSGRRVESGRPAGTLKAAGAATTKKDLPEVKRCLCPAKSADDFLVKKSPRGTELLSRAGPHVDLRRGKRSSVTWGAGGGVAIAILIGITALRRQTSHRPADCRAWGRDAAVRESLDERPLKASLRSAVATGQT